MNAYFSLLRRFPMERPMAAVVAAYLLVHLPLFLQTFSLTSLRLIPAIVMGLIFISGLVAVVGLWKRESWGYIPVLFFIPALTLFSGAFSLDGLLLRNLLVLSLNSSVFMLCAWSLMRKMEAA